MIRWVSFGASAMPRLPPLADHEDPVEFDDGLPSVVEPARPDPDESEPGPAAGLPAGRPGLAPQLGSDHEVLEETPVVVHATLAERGSRNVMNVVGATNRPPKGSRCTQGNSPWRGHLGLRRSARSPS